MFKGKSSLSQVDGSEEKVYKKYTNTNLAFYKKNDDQIRFFGGAFEHNFGGQGTELWMNQSLQVQMPRIALGKGGSHLNTTRTVCASCL